MTVAERDRLRVETKRLLRQAIRNPKEEAYRQGVSLSTVYSWMDPRKMLDFPLFRVGASTALVAIVQHIKGLVHPASFTHSMADDWATLTELFGEIYRQYRNGEYDPTLAGIFARLADNILLEWEHQSKKETP